MLRVLVLLAVSVAAEYAYSGNPASAGVQAARQTKAKVQKRVISYALAEAVFKMMHQPAVYKIRELISQGSDPNDGSNPLYIAVETRNLLAVEELLNSDADPNAKLESRAYRYVAAPYRYHHGSAPLHRAAQFNAEMVELLLEYKADIEVKDRDGRTPFLHAVPALKLESTQLLINHAANVHAKTKDGRNAMHLLVRAALTGVDIDDFINMAKLLVSLGVDINAPDSKGQTPLYALVTQTYRTGGHSFLVRFPFSHNSSAHQKLVTFFIENGADPDIADHNGITPMMVDLVLRGGVFINTAVDAPVKSGHPTGS